MGERSQMVKISGYNVKVPGCGVQHGHCSEHHTVYLRVARRMSPQSYQKEKNV